MNGIWKKIAALVLVMCLVISVLPPVALATDTDAVSYTYEFARGPSVALAKDLLLNTITDYSMSNNGLWKFAGEWGTGYSKIINANNNSQRVWQLNYGGSKKAENYYAMYIMVPEAGTYDLSMTYVSGLKTCTSGVYLLPVSAVTKDGAYDAAAVKAELAKKTSSAYYVGSVVDTTGTPANNAVANLNEQELAAGEYVLAFNYLEGADYYFYCRNLILTKQVEEVPEASTPEESVPEESVPEESVPEESVPEESVPEESVPEVSTPEESVPEETTAPEVTEESYEPVSHTYDFIRGPEAFITNNTQLNTVTDYSKSNNGLWKYAGGWSSGNIATLQVGEATRAFWLNYGKNRTNASYVALYINVPKAGTYNLSVTNSTGRYDVTSGVYIFPAGNVTADGALNTTALTTELKKTTSSAYYVGSVVDTDSDNDDAVNEVGVINDLGLVNFAEAGEYVVAFNWLEGEQYAYFRSITLTERITREYDFIRGPEAYITNNTQLNTVTDYSKSNNGLWKYAGGWSAGSIATLQVGEATRAFWLNYGKNRTNASYVALYIKVPEAGTYNLSVTNSTGRYDVTSGVYIFPAGNVTADGALNTTALTTELNKTTSSAYYVGSVVDTDSDNDDAVDEVGVINDLGLVNFAKAGEYVVAFNWLDGEQYAYFKSITLDRRVAAVGEQSFVTVAEAVDAAATAESKNITLLSSITEIREVIIPSGATLDLNGYNLTIPALSGSVVDSSEGNTGLLKAASNTVVFSEDNADIPLYDYTARGYRLFDYTMDNYTVRPVGEASQKFWYKFHFRTSDAADAAVDQDAYALVKGGYTGFQISAEMTWAGEALDTVYFGRNYEGLETNTEKMDAFSKEWATYDGEANDGRWLFVTVRGLGEGMVGELTVKPVITANNVVIAGETMSYTAAG